MTRRPPKPEEKEPSSRFKNRSKLSSVGKDDAWRSATPEEFDEILAELSNGSDRSAAILSAAYVEMSLRFAVFSRFVKMGPQEARKLASQSGPLSSFSQTIDVGFAVGLYGPVIRRNLHKIREVRNLFAHRFLPISFDYSEVQKLVSEIDYRKNDMSHNVDLMIARHGPSSSRERELFIEACRMIVVDVTSIMKPEHRPTVSQLP